jgi:hypothetical protein
MDNRNNQEASALSFDARLWLDTFTTLGGGYVVYGERKIAFLVAGICALDLAMMMRVIAGRPERLEALKDAVEHHLVREAA